MKFDNGPNSQGNELVFHSQRTQFLELGPCQILYFNIEIIFLLSVLTPSVKALGPISEIQPMGIKDLASKRPWLLV
jgi:hypothetical protein